MRLFESGAILLYLAELTGRLLPADRKGRYTSLTWLIWQVGGLGPMAGQAHHFRSLRPQRSPWAPLSRWTAHVDGDYQGAAQTDVYNTANTQMQSRLLIKGSLTYHDPNGKWTFTPWISNAPTRLPRGGLPVAGLWNFTKYGPPRSPGMTANQVRITTRLQSSDSPRKQSGLIVFWVHGATIRTGWPIAQAAPDPLNDGVTPCR